jgi:hypothetical protein
VTERFSVSCDCIPIYSLKGSSRQRDGYGLE